MKYFIHQDKQCRAEWTDTGTNQEIRCIQHTSGHEVVHIGYDHDGYLCQISEQKFKQGLKHKPNHHRWAP